MKYEPIDLIYNFMLSKARTSNSHLQCIYLVYDFIYHTPSFEYVPIYNFILIFAGNLSIYRQDCDSAYSAPIQHDAVKKIKLFNYPKLQASKATCSPIR